MFEPFNIQFSACPAAFEPKDLVIKRTLSQMKEVFAFQDAAATELEKGDKLILEVFMAPIPSEKGHFMPLMTVIYPGTVGGEYFMTKGHIHEDYEDSPEVYITLKGQGKLVLQSPEGETRVLDMLPNVINYIPSGWAHRSINTSLEDELVFLGVYKADAKRDYSFIGLGKENFHKIIVEKNGQPVVVDYPGN